MSGILIVSGKPRPDRLTAVVEDSKPPPPRDLPRVNPLIPITLTLATGTIVYFSGWLQIGPHEQITIAQPKAVRVVRKAPARPRMRRAPMDLERSQPVGTRQGLAAQVKKLSFEVGRNPTSQATYAERMAALRSYFSLMNPVDKKALFGTEEFDALEAALQALETAEEAFALLDRLFIRLRLTFH